MNTVTLFKSLQDAFSLPALPVIEGIKVADWEWSGVMISAELYMDGMAEGYAYTCSIDPVPFRAYCELTSVIEGPFCEWFNNLSWGEQLEEIECYTQLKLKLIPAIKADYANWIANNTK